MLYALMFLLGLAPGTGLAVVITARALRARRPQALNVDYKERWHEAITLLAEQGQLTDEQVARLQPPASPAIPQADPALAALKTLHSLTSNDRRKLEVTRAENGLPPLDDLKGMISDDIRKVMQARIENGTAG